MGYNRQKKGYSNKYLAPRWLNAIQSAGFHISARRERSTDAVNDANINIRIIFKPSQGLSDAVG